MYFFHLLILFCLFYSILQLAKRTQKRKEANASKEEAEEVGDTEAIDKFNRRLVKVTPEHNAECKKLLKLLGIPYVEVHIVPGVIDC